MDDNLRSLLEGTMLDGHTLSSTFEIENILLLLEDINKKVDYYKDLKKSRVKSVDEKISSLTQKENILRQVILNTMKSLKEKSLDFPDIGKVSMRKAKSAIVLDDQDKIISYLDQKGLKSGIVKIIESIDKRKLNSLVSDLEKQGETIPGISKVLGSESLSVSFEKPKNETIPFSDSKPNSRPELDIDDLDALVI